MRAESILTTGGWFRVTLTTISLVSLLVRPSVSTSSNFEPLRTRRASCSSRKHGFAFLARRQLDRLLRRLDQPRGGNFFVQPAKQRQISVPSTAVTCLMSSTVLGSSEV